MMDDVDDFVIICPVKTSIAGGLRIMKEGERSRLGTGSDTLLKPATGKVHLTTRARVCFVLRVSQPPTCGELKRGAGVDRMDSPARFGR